MLGLKESDIEKLRTCFRQNNVVEKAIVFGSRALGNYKNRSDVDIALIGEGITNKTLTRIRSFLEETTIPYSFDLVIYTELENKELIAHIDEAGIELYKREGECHGT